MDDASAERTGKATTRERIEALLTPGAEGAWSSSGYLDTMPAGPAGSPAPPGRAQSAWESALGSALYGQVLQPLAASPWLTPAFGLVPSRLRLVPGQTVADVGCGPGNVTTALADAVGPSGLVVGVAVSAPMLARAAAGARANTGLLRGDATAVPLRTASVDAACATAVVMLVDDPDAALAELVRLVRPGGWVLVMVPVAPLGPFAGLSAPFWERFCRFAGARQFTADELAGMLEAHGCDRVLSDQQGVMLTVTARTSAGDRPH